MRFTVKALVVMVSMLVGSMGLAYAEDAAPAADTTTTAAPAKHKHHGKKHHAKKHHAKKHHAKKHHAKTTAAADSADAAAPAA